MGRGLRKFENKNHVTILDFIGNSYRRSVHIALALGSLSKGYILEKKLLKSMVKEDFQQLGLKEYGVKIEIDDLSKEEIIEYIEKENFNQIRYLKKDYENFKSYLKTPTYPKHMDYMNSDYAPNLLKFMKVKIGGNKTNSYYGFLKGIEENSVPSFTEEQVVAINYLSNLLPLVRRYEYLAVKCILDGVTSKSDISQYLAQKIKGYSVDHFEHAIRFLIEEKVIYFEGNDFYFCCDVDDEFVEYVSDLLDYGLVQYEARYINEEDFLLYQDYRQDQVLLKILKNPKNNQYGTYYQDGKVYIFAGLKKDASVQDHLNYKDKFLDETTFQWESIARISAKDEELQRNSKEALVFVRKVKEENGITLPYTFVGAGSLTNPRKGVTDNGSILYDIKLNNSLPADLMEDFKWVD
ncbi:MAG: DUF3427 domain-containing protein [Paludibacteraceae bacterium]|nr:DUF3427 domain-containing protein [Paludibacteraceae bacterium]